MKHCIYLLIVLFAFGCKKNANDLPQTEAIPENEMIPQDLLSTSKVCVFGTFVPGKLDSKGALVTAPAGFAFNLGTATPATFFKAIADRRAATAGLGQFYCLGNTHPSYANTIKVLNKMGALGKLTQLSSGKKVATITPAAWWSSTGGVYKPKQISYSTGGTKFPTNAAALGYKDATGKTFTVYFTFGTILSGYTYPRLSSTTQVATAEAFADGTEFKIANGNSAGKGRRWFDTCNPGADYSSGSYDLITEIPGMSATIVGAGFTAFASALFDDISAYCSL